MAAAYTLYGSFLSSHTYKVGLMLALCGEAFDYRHVDLSRGEHKTPEFLALNRFGQVPTITHDGMSLCQSDSILEHIAQQTGKFAGATDEERQRIREWLCWYADRLEPGIGRSRFFERFAKPDPAVAEFMRKVGETGLGVLNSLLEGRRFLVGERPTIADIGIYGAVVHMEEAKFDPPVWPNVKAWRERIAALPGYRAPYDLLPKADQAGIKTL